MLGTMMDYPLTLAQILEHAHSIHGEKQVHTQLPNGKVYTYNYTALYRRVKQLANAIAAVGIRPGDRVATFASNTYQHLELCCAVPYTGAIIHPLNVRLAPAQLAKIVEEVDDKLFFVDGVYAEQFSQLQHKIDRKHVVLFNTDTGQHKNRTNFSTEYEKLIAEADDNYISDILDENWAMGLCYTSGTDGEPKGVLYTHRSMFLHTLAVNQADVFGLTESDVVMPLVPMFHAIGWGLPYASMFAGADIVFANANHDQIVELIAETGVTVAAGVPTVWAKLLPELRKRKQDISSLHRLIVGGEPMPSTLIEVYEKELRVEVRHAWGMTEMSPTGTFCTLRKAHQHLSDTEKWKIKSMQGRPIPGVQMRLVNENGIELPWDGNAIGEVQVRSPWTASSYYKNTPLPEHFTADGWLRTGDLATINAEGYMQIVDRAKALIRSGGESISTVALEAMLLKHPCVNDAAVIGIPNEKWGERPIAVVALSSQAENISEILMCHLTTEFPKFWIPDKFIIVDKIPKTGVGKTDKRAILKMFAPKHKGNFTMLNTNHKLSQEDMDQFRKQGYLGPYTLCSPEDMLNMQPEIEHILETDAPDHKNRVHNRHLDFPLIHDLATHPTIVERMASLYGPDLLLWRTNFFVKEPGAKEIPWHQDFNYWPLEPPIIISAWIAIDSATLENSCLQIVPGSHRKVIPHVKATSEMAFNQMGDLDFIDTTNFVNLEMQPGEFVLFNERTLHHSEANRSDKRRIGLAIRVIVPIVKVFDWDSPQHELIVIHGEDPVQFNERS